MIKKIVIALVCVLPLGAFAQNLKFGHVNFQELIVSLPEFTAAQSELTTLGQKFSKEAERSREEFNKKLQEYQQALQTEESLPANIAERRQKELSDLAQRAEEFEQDAQQQLGKKQEELYMPLQQKVIEAIQSYGQENGFVYIFDISSTPIPYVSETLSTDVTPLIKTKLGIR
ncbi:MAG: OmpH family outer membrane protein [Bacteroides sp.]|nr:OmpH family outer membrane protein [Bacteroides sp.]